MPPTEVTPKWDISVYGDGWHPQVAHNLGAMPLVPTDDTTGLTPAFWTPSIAKSTQDSDEELPTAASTAGADPGTADVSEAAGGQLADDATGAVRPVGDTAAGEEDVNPTADTQSLHPLDDNALPVFLDTTGRRRRRVRALLWLVSLAGLTYATVLVLSLLSGHDSQSLMAPEYRPGDRSPAATGAPVASVQATIPRSRDAAATPPAAGPGTTSDAQTTPSGSTATKPAATPGATAPAPRGSSPAAAAPSVAPASPAPAAPSTPATSPSPSSTGGLVDGLLDTLFPWAS